MKHKLLLLFLTVLCSMWGWAQSPITARSQINADKLYTITASDGRGSWMYGSSDPLFVTSTYKQGVSPSSSDSKQQWAFWEKDGSFYLS